jgi:apolipoprotein N-acyltransferase
MFPETVVPMWTAATDLFWQQTLAELRASGKTIVLGVGRPLLVNFRVPRLPEQVLTTPSYQNTVLIAGAESAIFYQRIPVPSGMWKPFSNSGVPLNLLGPGVAQVAGERAAILICFEQLLTWPILRSMEERPSLVLAIANDHWATSTPIPRCQTTTVRTWCRLFRLPLLSATNY